MARNFAATAETCDGKDFLKQLASNIAKQFGRNCEVVVHEFQGEDMVITHIENGHVTGRRVGEVSTNDFYDEFFEKDFLRNPIYRNRTENGREMLSSTSYYKRENGEAAFLCINYDITELLATSRALDWVNYGAEQSPSISDVSDMLEYHLRACEKLIGKRAEQMDREEKYRAVEYLESKHVFLISKSSVRVCEYLGITKYSLYTFLDEIRKGK